MPLPLHTHPAQDDCAPLSQSGSGPLWKFGFCVQFLLFVSFDSGHQQPKPYVWNRPISFATVFQPKIRRLRIRRGSVHWGCFRHGLRRGWTLLHSSLWCWWCFFLQNEIGQFSLSLLTISKSSQCSQDKARGSLAQTLSCFLSPIVPNANHGLTPCVCVVDMLRSSRAIQCRHGFPGWCCNAHRLPARGRRTH